MSFYIDLAKSSKGEGSRGGHVIGHTKGGDPIYGAPATRGSESEKPIHKMTRSEYEKKFGKWEKPGIGDRKQRDGETYAEAADRNRHPHEKAIEDRLKIGMDYENHGVPEHVLQDYPSLKEKYSRLNHAEPSFGDRDPEWDKSEKLVGGLADGKPDSEFPEDKLEQGKKVESEHTKDKQLAKEIAKDHIKEDPEYYTKLKKIERSFLYIDLMKARPHKYIRKYRGRGGDWIYIYYEGDHHHKMSVREQELLHEMAEKHGNRHARSLIDDADEIHSGHLKLLDELADVHGNEKARKERDHLKDVMGDDHRHVLNPHEADHPFLKRTQEKVKEAIKAAIAPEFDHLDRYRDNPLYTKLVEAGITRESILDAVDPSTLRTTLNSLHGELNKMDAAHTGLTSSRNSNGYGNKIYKEAIKKMQEAGVLPEGYDEVHARGGDIHEPSKVTEERERLRREATERAARERAEREAREARDRAEREERDRREEAGLVSTIGYKMSQMMTDGSRSQRLKMAKDFNRTARNIFGKDIPIEAFPYDFSSSGIKVKIDSISINERDIYFYMTAYNERGEQLTRKFERGWNVSGGRPHIHNYYLAVNEDAKGGAKIGHLVNETQRSLMTDHTGPEGGTVTVYAALSVGPYMWCNTGFSYQSESERQTHVRRLKDFLQDTGQSLTDEQIALFKEPCHFAAFDDGKLYELRLANPSKLTPKQIETGYLDGVPNGRWKLTTTEKADGKSMRMAVNAGKYLLLRNPGASSWNGIWDSKKDTVAHKYAIEYVKNKTQALQKLGQKFLNLFQRAMTFYIDLFKARKRDLA